MADCRASAAYSDHANGIVTRDDLVVRQRVGRRSCMNSRGLLAGATLTLRSWKHDPLRAGPGLRCVLTVRVGSIRREYTTSSACHRRCREHRASDVRTRGIDALNRSRIDRGFRVLYSASIFRSGRPGHPSTSPHVELPLRRPRARRTEHLIKRISFRAVDSHTRRRVCRRSR